MPPYKHLQRYREIVGVLVDEGLDSVVDAAGLRRFAPVSGRLGGTRKHPEPVPVRLRHTLERLGPAFVKIGQAASTRSDVIPEAFTDELRKLQDEVAPFPFAQVRKVLEAELGAPLSEIFQSFDEEPLASASLGQVHAAVLPDGTEVAVKIQRPGVRDVVECDLDILMRQARFVSQHSELAGRYDVVEISDEFANAVRNELDYMTEASNAERLGSLFVDDETVYFPGVYWEFTTSRVLTLDRIEGVRMNRPDLLDAEGFNRSELARRGIYSYLEQIFSHGFFHADPHPGNLFAMADGRVAFTDFGRIGTIGKVGRDQLADLFLAIVDDDVGLAVDTLVSAAGSPGDIDVQDLEREVSRLITKYYNKSLKEVRVGELISEVLALVRDHHLILPSELAMLLATLVVLEGLGTQLDPDFDFVAVTAPFARRIIDERFEPHSVARTLAQSLRRFSRLATELPESMTRFMRRAGSGEFRIAVYPTGFDPILKRLEEVANRIAFALVVGAFVVGLSMLLDDTPKPDWFLWVARFALAAALGVGSWFFISIMTTRYRRR
ncbi:MAG TPA: AarF/ABC1/UbiB kinase family protein [Coriobacteriia bacterium]|nr:AarF/ABC1/UbiB kinase family protein [Coriobacteriia bacterium]